MATDISSSDDIIDIRDVSNRIDELREETEEAEDHARTNVTLVSTADDEYDSDRPWTDGYGNYYETESEAQDGALENLREDMGAEYDELKNLESLVDDVGGEDGPLIRDSYFTDYCQELVQDIGDLPRNIPGYLVIDWEATADNLRVDYSSTEFDGVTYWYR